MKKFFYIIATVFLGLLLSLIAHAVIEMIALHIIFTQPEKYFETFWWQDWSTVHRVGSLILSFLGLAAGLYFTSALPGGNRTVANPAFITGENLLIYGGNNNENRIT